MASMKEKIAQARAAKDSSGKRLFSDDEIYQKLVSTDAGKKALEAVGPEELRTYFGLDAAPTSAQDPNPVSRAVKMYGGAAAEGAGEFLGLPGTGLRLLNSLVPDDWKWSKDSPLWKIPAGSDITSAMRNAGIVDRPDAQPQDLGERLNVATAKGLGSAAPSAALAAATGGASLIPELMASGGAAGLSGGGANELMPGNSAAEFIASLAGGLTGQTLTRAAKGAFERAAVMKELDAANVAWGDIEKNGPGMAIARGALKDSTLAQIETNKAAALDAARVRAGAREAPAKAAIQGIADTLAPKALGWQDAGDALRADAQNWYTTKMPAALETAWSPVDAKVPQDLNMSLDSFNSALAAVNKRAGTLQPLVDKLTPSLPKSLQADFAKILEGQGEGVVPDFTWSDARTLRTALGDAMRDPRIMPNMGDANLKQLYAALTDDLKTAATGAGAGKEFDVANAASKTLFGIAEGPIAKVLDSSTASGVLAKNLVNAGKVDAADLTTLRGVVPQGMDNLASTALRNNDAGQPLADWTKLTPQTKAALIPDQTARDAVDSSLFDLTDSSVTLRGDTAGVNRASDLAKENILANYKTATAEAQQAKLETRLRRNAAQSAANKLADKSTSLADNIRTIKQMGVGGSVGALGMGLLGISPAAFQSSTFGAAAGIGIPSALHVAQRVVQNPELTMGPLIGVSAGNALSAGNEASGGQ